MSDIQATRAWRLLILLLFTGAAIVVYIGYASAEDLNTKITEVSAHGGQASYIGGVAYAEEPPVKTHDDGAAHIIIGPVMIAYLKIFCWVVGAMFFILSLIAGGLGWFFKRTLDRMDETIITLANNQAAIVKKQDDLQSDMDGLLAEHNLRGKLCPGLRPDLLKEVVASILGVSHSQDPSHLHRRAMDEPAETHDHARESDIEDKRED